MLSKTNNTKTKTCNANVRLLWGSCRALVGIMSCGPVWDSYLYLALVIPYFLLFVAINSAPFCPFELISEHGAHLLFLQLLACFWGVSRGDLKVKKKICLNMYLLLSGLTMIVKYRASVAHLYSSCEALVGLLLGSCRAPVGLLTGSCRGFCEALVALHAGLL